MRDLKHSLSMDSDNDADDEEQKEDILYIPTEGDADSPDVMARFVIFKYMHLQIFPSRGSMCKIIS